MSKNRFSVIVLLLLSVILVSCSESVDDVLNKSIKARGNVEAQKAMKTITADIKTISFGFELTMKTFIVIPSKIRVELNMLGRDIVTITNDSQGWLQSDTVIQALPPEQISENRKTILKQIEFFRSELLSDVEKSIKKELMPDDTINGKKVYKLKLVNKDSVEKYFYIDKNTYLVYRTQEMMKLGGVKYINQTDMANYKEVQGFMIPHMIESKQNGNLIGKLAFSNVKFNDELKPQLFEMPVRKDK